MIKYKDYTVTLNNKHGHVHVALERKGFYKYKLRGLTSIKSNLTSFERKVVELYFFKLLRDNTEKHNINVGIINYAEIFGSCFERTNKGDI